jgi:hypothetical protein
MSAASAVFLILSLLLALAGLVVLRETGNAELAEALSLRSLWEGKSLVAPEL